MSWSIKVVHATRQNAEPPLPDTRPIKARQSKRNAQHDGKILGSELNLSGKESLFFRTGDPSPRSAVAGGIHASHTPLESPLLSERPFWEVPALSEKEVSFLTRGAIQRRDGLAFDREAARFTSGGKKQMAHWFDHCNWTER